MGSLGGGGGVDSFGGGGVGSFGGGGVGSFGGGGGVASLTLVFFLLGSLTVSSALNSSTGGCGLPGTVSSLAGLLKLTVSSGKFSTGGRSSFASSVMDFRGPGSVTLMGLAGGGGSIFGSLVNDSRRTSLIGVAARGDGAGAVFRMGGSFSLAMAFWTHFDS